MDSLSSRNFATSKRDTQLLSPKKLRKISEFKSIGNSVSKNYTKATKMKLKTHRNSKKFNTQEYEQCRENLKSFIAKISKIEEKNFITLKELQNEFNLVMDNFPTNQEIMTLFDNIYQRLTVNNTQKRNWYQEDVILLFWLVSRYAGCHQKSSLDFTQEDWVSLGHLIPEKDSDRCKYKFLSMKKTNANLLSNPWTLNEEEILKEMLLNKSKEEIKWDKIAKELYMKTKNFRTGKLCRERWKNYLDPHLKKSAWTENEDFILIERIMNFGKKWCEISRNLPGRNEHNVKNRYFSLLRQEKKRLKKLLLSNNKNKNKRRKKFYTNIHKFSENELIQSLYALKIKDKTSEPTDSIMNEISLPCHPKKEYQTDNFQTNNIQTNDTTMMNNFINQGQTMPNTLMNNFNNDNLMKDMNESKQLNIMNNNQMKLINNNPMSLNLMNNSNYFMNNNNLIKQMNNTNININNSNNNIINNSIHNSNMNAPINNQMRNENPFLLNNFYNFMPNFMPFSLNNNPFASQFFQTASASSMENFNNFNQNPFHKLSDSLEKMDLQAQNKEKPKEDLKIISLSYLDGDGLGDKALDLKEHSMTPRGIAGNFDEITPNFMQVRNRDISVKAENLDFLNLRVKNFQDLSPREKTTSHLKLAVINLEKNEVYFLQQPFNNNNVTSDSSYKSGSFISMNNSNTSNSLSMKFDIEGNNENYGVVQSDGQKRSKFVKFMNMND